MAPKTYVLVGGEWSKRTATKCSPASFPSSTRMTLNDRRRDAAPRSRQLAGRSEEPADPARDGEPDLAGPLRHRHRGHSSDFGVMGDRPSNQQLLDYLLPPSSRTAGASRRCTALIMLSNAYQESSLAQTEATAADPENKLMWRYPRHRVEGEVLRDAMLHDQRQAEPEDGGPGVRPELPPGVKPSVTLHGQPKGQGRGRPAQRLYLRQARPDLSDVRGLRRAQLQESCPRRFPQWYRPRRWQ